MPVEVLYVTGEDTFLFPTALFHSSRGRNAETHEFHKTLPHLLELSPARALTGAAFIFALAHGKVLSEHFSGPVGRRFKKFLAARDRPGVLPGMNGADRAGALVYT